jgi:hypothetical protein
VAAWRASRYGRVAPRGAVSHAALVVSGVLVPHALGREDRGYMTLVLWCPRCLTLVGSLGLPLASTYSLPES